MSPDEIICRKFCIVNTGVYPLIGRRNRNHLGELFAELGYKVGAEVGVRRGKFSEVLLLGNPGLKLYCIDPWVSYPEAPDQKVQDQIFEFAKARLSLYNAEIIKKTSMDALSDIPNESLDFVYVDGAHDFENVMIDITGWSDKVRKGGIISGHDYPMSGVKPVVDAVVKDLCWYLTRGVSCSYFWVKL